MKSFFLSRIDQMSPPITGLHRLPQRGANKPGELQKARFVEGIPLDHVPPLRAYSAESRSSTQLADGGRLLGVHASTQENPPIFRNLEALDRPWLPEDYTRWLS